MCCSHVAVTMANHAHDLSVVTARRLWYTLLKKQQIKLSSSSLLLLLLLLLSSAKVIMIKTTFGSHTVSLLLLLMPPFLCLSLDPHVARRFPKFIQEMWSPFIHSIKIFTDLSFNPIFSTNIQQRKKCDTPNSNFFFQLFRTYTPCEGKVWC